MVQYGHCLGLHFIDIWHKSKGSTKAIQIWLPTGKKKFDMYSNIQKQLKPGAKVFLWVWDMLLY